MKRSILLIATIDAPHEVAALKSRHNVHVAPHDELHEAGLTSMALASQYDIVWWLCHATARGIELKNGSALSPGAVVRIVTSAQQGVAVSDRLCVINSCESMTVSSAVANEAESNVICTLASELKESKAVGVGITLSHHILKEGTYYEAYKLSKAGEEYIFLGVNGGHPVRWTDYIAPIALSVIAMALTMIAFLLAIGAV